MKIVWHLVLSVLFIVIFTSPGFSNNDEKHVIKAEAFLERISNVNELDLEYVLQKHIKLLETTDDLATQSRELEFILGYAVQIEDYGQIVHYTNMQADLGQKLNDPVIQAMAKCNLIYSKSLNGETRASYIELLAHEIEIAESGNLKLRIHFTTLRGLMANGVDKTLESVELLKSMDREIKDIPEYDWHRMLLYWTIAWNAVGSDNLDLAIEYYSRSVELAIANQWAIDNSSIMFNLASLLRDEKAYASAEKYLRKYGEISTSVGRQADVFFMHYGLASLFLDQKDYNATLTQVKLALAFDDTQIGFTPFLYQAETESLLKLNRVEEAKTVFEDYKKFISDNDDYRESREEISLQEIDANIMFAEGNLQGAYKKYVGYTTKIIDKIENLNRVDAAGMREGLEAAIAKEEAENKLAQSEIANQNMFLGAAILVVIILVLFYAVQKKSAAALKISKAEADSANLAKSKFLANVSHELRTPLNAIIGFSDIMKNEYTGQMKDEQYKEYSSLVNDAGRHLLSIINDILDLNKIEAGKMELNEEAIDIAWLLDDINHLLGQTAIKSAIELQFNSPEGLPELYGDERQIKQILINLVNNSIKFSDSDTIIHTSAHLRQEGGITIKIQDQGQGMTEVELEKALQPFSQVKDNLNSDQEGTGLGLPLAKAMTELHNGIMDITSVKGEGTLVELNFPVERVIPVNG